MEIALITFGKISEFIQNQKIELVKVTDTDELQAHLERLFPRLKGMKYKLALNNSIVQSKQEIKNNDSIAIMPPFSGG